jgi:lipid II:glycine glycyltransferase (peptidoglycan interpeptide bridge formation enzyme)
MKTDRIIQSHPLQSAAWAEFRRSMGIDVVQVAGTFVSFHRIPHTPWTIGYIPKGALPTQSMLQKLAKVGQEKHAIFIQIEPNRIATRQALQKMHTLPLRPSAHPLFTKYTFVLDLSKSEEELLKAMHSKTRYNIRVAQKHGVIIKHDNSDEAFAAYLRLSEETTKRQEFYAHNTTYHKTMWKILKTARIAQLFTATYNGEILAAWVMFVHNDTIYYPYGASSRNHREVMAPSLLLWEIIRWAKSQNLRFLDLWGAIGPNPDPNDPWYGFHRFKEGVKPDLVEYVGSYDFVIQPWLYPLYVAADKLRWWWLKKKS